MFTQTIAIFVDAYRELNARKLFWIVLAISGLVVISFAAVGIDPQGISFFGAHFNVPFLNSEVIPPADFYKGLFQTLGIGYWLTWGATILAIVSTAGIFPDLLSGGALELYLSKPMGRLRLFGLKYISGLLFVTLQVLVFCLACFLVIGIRAHSWEPGLFLAVPLVVCFFSYLFCICVLLGIMTRSTIAAALLTILLWFCIAAMSGAEKFILTVVAANEQSQTTAQKQLTYLQRRIDAERNAPPTTNAVSMDQGAVLQSQRASLQKELDDATTSVTRWRAFHRLAFATMTVMPKTGETLDLLERELVHNAHLKKMPADSDDTSMDDSAIDNRRMDTMRVGERVHDELQKRSVSWIIGTSLLFEAAVLTIAGWKFCRRDG